MFFIELDYSVLQSLSSIAFPESVKGMGRVMRHVLGPGIFNSCHILLINVEYSGLLRLFFRPWSCALLLSVNHSRMLQNFRLSQFMGEYKYFAYNVSQSTGWGISEAHTIESRKLMSKDLPSQLLIAPARRVVADKTAA